MKVIATFFGLALLYLAHIGTRPLANPDEGRYASIGAEILRTNEWIVPHLNGLIYFEKPPLGYWLTALGEKIFGVTLFGARFFNALATLLTCGVLYVFCRRFLPKKVGLCAAILYGTSGLPFGLSQVLTLDNFLTFFLTTTLLLFAWGFLEENETRATYCFYGAYLFMALTVLTKGLIGLVFPALIGFPWLLFTGHWRKLNRACLFRGTLLFLVIAVPWHVAVQRKYECFFNFYFWHEHFERYLTDTHLRGKPWYFLPTAFLCGLMPWTFFLPRLTKNALFGTRNCERQIVLFALLWMLGVVGFFSCSHSQLIPYILPAVPAACLLMAVGLGKTQVKNLRFESLLWALAFLATAVVGPSIVKKRALVPIPTDLVWIFESILIIGSVGALFWLMKSFRTSDERYVQRAFGGLLTTTVLLYLLFPKLMPSFQRWNAQPLCRVIRQREAGEVEVFGLYGYFHDVPFYLNQNIGTLEYFEPEHTLGIKIQGCDRYVRWEAFQTRWKEKKCCYAIVKNICIPEFEGRMREYGFYPLTKNECFTLYCNCP